MAVPPISKPTLWFFRQVVRRYFRRHFRAVRVDRAELFKGCGDGPVIVYANHSSWWDPMVSILLASVCQPRRKHFAPMDAEALKQYGILKRVGIFGVEMNTLRGARRFLESCLSILESGGILWITPQGRFSDPRETPIVFRPGLGALASRVKGGCTVLPLAIEYTFWNERLPEVLLHFGEPIHVHGESAKELESTLRTALEHAMKALEQKAIARNPLDFDLLQSGRVGTGGWYQLGQHTLALLRGRTFHPEHTKVDRREEHG